jgi:putative aldouronate transport system substrate-binding protein
MKKAFIKRSLLVLTAAVLSASMLACAKKEPVETQKPAAEVTKPTVITAMLDTTFLIPEVGQAQFLEEYKKQTGIELKVTQPAHNQYYEKVNLAFASGEAPDVVELGGTPLVNYSINGALYDITKLVDSSAVMKNIDQKYKDAVKVDGKMYAFPIQVGNGAITYLRQDWLDKNNLKVPTTYAEYINVLKVFSDDPDKNGKKDTIGFTAPGLIGDETPFAMYMREFYQDAEPDFVKKNGKWVDGMTEPEMKAALQRMRDAYAQGLMDKEIITNKTSTCRDKWNAGKVGAFTYWAGSWNLNLDNDLKKAVPDAKMVAIPAIKETKYIDRVPTTLAITSKAKNPEGIFKHLIEFMHDGDKGTLLFTDGVENVHYKKNADGKVELLPNLNDPKKLAIKSYIDFGLNLEKNFKNPLTLDPRVETSLATFNANSKSAVLLPASEEYSKASADLLTSKKEVISKIVLGEMSVDDGLAKYSKDNKSAIESILKSFNTAK